MLYVENGLEAIMPEPGSLHLRLCLVCSMLVIVTVMRAGRRLELQIEGHNTASSCLRPSLTRKAARPK